MYSMQRPAKSSHELEPSTAQSAGPAAASSTSMSGPGPGAAGPEGDTCNPGEADAEKTAFLAQAVYGPQDLAHAISVGSGTGIGGFEATYVTGTSMLMIQVTGKVQFRDAVEGSHPSFTTQHSDLSNLVTFLNSLPAETAAQVLGYFQWDDTAKQESLDLFNQRLAETTDIWQNTGLSFQVNDPDWCDVTAQPFFSLQVGAEGAAGAGEHLQVTVYKEPTPEERAEMDTLLSEAGSALPSGTGVGIRANAGTNMGANAPGYSGATTDPRRSARYRAGSRSSTTATASQRTTPSP